MPIDVGERFVRRHDAARSSTANATAADIAYDTAVISEGGYSWSSPEVTVDTAGLYLYIGDIGQVDLASTRAVGTLAPAVNGTLQNPIGLATHRYLRNSGGDEGASFGCGILDLSASDAVKVRNPGTGIGQLDALGNYATRINNGGGLQLIRFPDENFTQLIRNNSDADVVGISNINTTRPWIDSSGIWEKLTWQTESRDDDNLAADLNGNVTLKANKKYMIVWGAAHYSTDGSRHTYVTALNIDGERVQTGSGYQRTTASQCPPMTGIYFHEVGGTDETAYLEATQETEGGDAGNPQFRHGFFQILELPDSAEWIHADNGTTDSMTTALAGTGTYYDTPLSSTFRADGGSNLSLDAANDAVQNDSGGSLSVLAVGWHRWDRDSGASGTRKMPWSRFDNGGTAIGYGINGAYSRGQQGADDNFQAHYCAAVTLDMANAADLKFQANEPASGSNADMGIYASTNRHFLGVQVLDLSTLVSGGGTNHTQDLDDTVSFVDSESKNLTAPVTDALSLTDSTSKSVDTNLSSTASFADGLLKSAEKSFSDNISLGDALETLKGCFLQIDDTINFSESASFGVVATIQDAISLTEQLSQSLDKIIADGVVISEAKATATETALADVISLTDLETSAQAKQISDNLSAIDVLLKGISIPLGDAVSIVDQYSDDSQDGTDYVLSLDDTVSFSDSPSFSMGISIVESVSFITNNVEAPSIQKSDSVNISDVESKKSTTAISDLLSVSDQAAIGQEINLSDGFSLLDSILKGSGKDISESIAIIDQYSDNYQPSTDYVVNLSDSVSLSENIGFSLRISVNETISLSDSQAKTPKKTISETFTIADQVLGLYPSWEEVLYAECLLERNIVFYSNLQRAISEEIEMTRNLAASSEIEISKSAESEIKRDITLKSNIL